ncbi:hypothetical protein PLEOSDRAFT_1042144 [Pleurotus ostreatus PC15]|uniref:Alpha/beta hydrolase fold-3 domain-containing protein n=1 Tax=Pleurotus ostreatus (strain PC15) TaxID=1137138 RepID=A0A067NIK9_PLEO1|nr:hypothetical protein PLEOSDRAFT_1042144 [Pleurotus ostreatus PC15]
MIDHILGRPNPSWKRTQVFLVVFFWLWRIMRGNPGGPRFLWLRRANRSLQRFTPWQIIVSTLTAVYALRNLDKIIGLGSPEPLARLYSPSYYRATWITTGLDAGFATALSIRPKWLRDTCSVLFSVYYIIYANEADEKLRRFRAVPTVEMLRATWEKTTNPLIRLFTYLPSIPIRRKILLPRPQSSSYQRPITAYLFFALPEKRLCKATDLILDFPGGGFVAMSPEHHEERLRTWAISTGRPVLSIDYGKAPEYPYPFAIDEAFDTYRVLVESAGAVLGMSGKKLNIIMSGDSAGATIAVNVVIKIIERNNPLNGPPPAMLLPLPLSLVMNYAALDFNFTSWMTKDNLRTLRSEHSSGYLPGLRELAAQKDHLQHVSPLSMVGDKKHLRRKGLRRKQSWKDTLRSLAGSDKENNLSNATGSVALKPRKSTSALKSPATRPLARRRHSALTIEDRGTLADAESEDDEEYYQRLREEDRPIEARVRHRPSIDMTYITDQAVLEERQKQVSADTTPIKGRVKEPIGTRLTMTSRTGYFQDRIISPSMMRAMAILYIGPYHNPDFATDYHISPILAPSYILAQFPPVLMQCGEKDPFVDDTVIFAGRLREAKRARKAELDLAISGKSARFGESLKMSTARESMDSQQLLSLKRERDKLSRETDDDWVELVIFSDWSHGYLQMPTLMGEAKAVIEELADWIDDAFRRHSSGYGDAAESELTEDSRILPTPDWVQTVRTGSTTASETEAEDSMITFVPKKYQSPPEVHTEDDGVEAGTTEISSGGGDHEADGGSDITTAETIAALASGHATGGSSNVTPSKRQGGQTISETELMRRRRLLDAHIFES